MKLMAELVGVLNLTPDSFSDGAAFYRPYYQPGLAVAHAEALFEDGAAIVDVGAESTRPGAIPIGSRTEWWRLERVLPVLMDRHPGQISLDTHRPETARKALELGDVIINDVTGMNNIQMVDTVAEYGARCIVSHLHGTDMQAVHTGRLISDPRVVQHDLLARHALLIDRGLKPEDVILDPGIGFGKTPELNRQLIEFAAELPEHAVMIGYSRKRFMAREELGLIEGDEKREDLAPNLRAGRLAIAAGAAYLRVHDIAGHAQLLY